MGDSADSSVGTASVLKARHSTDGGSSPWCRALGIFLPESTSSAECVCVCVCVCVCMCVCEREREREEERERDRERQRQRERERDRETEREYVCVCVLGREGSWVFASTALVVVRTSVYMTSFREPLSPPFRHHTKQMSSMITANVTRQRHRTETHPPLVERHVTATAELVAALRTLEMHAASLC